MSEEMVLVLYETTASVDVVETDWINYGGATVRRKQPGNKFTFAVTANKVPLSQVPDGYKKVTIRLPSSREYEHAYEMYVPEDYNE